MQGPLRGNVVNGEIVERVWRVFLDRITEGAMLNDLVRDKTMPCAGTLARTLAKDPKRWEEYKRARQAQMIALTDDTISIADSEEDPQRARVRIQARQWLASRWNAQQFGNESTVNVNVGVSIRDALDAAEQRRQSGIDRIVSDQVSGPLVESQAQRGLEYDSSNDIYGLDDIEDVFDDPMDYVSAYDEAMELKMLLE